MTTLDDMINMATNSREIKRALSVKMLQSRMTPQTITGLLNVSEQFVSNRMGQAIISYAEMQDDLMVINTGLPEEEWPVTCILFASNAPEQNPVEDIWLKGKNWLRKNFSFNKTFAAVGNYCHRSDVSPTTCSSAKYRLDESAPHSAATPPTHPTGE